jgi:hypothetical protein
MSQGNLYSLHIARHLSPYPWWGAGRDALEGTPWVAQCRCRLPGVSVDPMIKAGHKPGDNSGLTRGERAKGLPADPDT